MDLGWLQMMSSLDQKCHSVEQTFIKTLHYLEHTKKTKIKPVIKIRYVALCKGKGKPSKKVKFLSPAERGGAAMLYNPQRKRMRANWELRA